MAVRGTITYTGFLNGTKAAPKRAMAKAVRAANRAAGRFWYRRMLPRHFQSSAAGRYGYTDRTQRYRRSKRIRKGHDRPLVLSGRLRREVLRVERLTGGPKRVTVTLSGPRYFYEYPRLPRDMRGRPRRDRSKLDRPLSQYAKEATAVNQQELNQLAKLHDRVSTRVLNSDRTRRTVRV